MTGFPNVRLHKGWFHESLPGFLESHPEPIRFLHIDCDTYEATDCVLRLLEARIVPGTVILFDEMLNYLEWREHEHKAWQEFVGRTGIKFRWSGWADADYGVAVVVG